MIKPYISVVIGKGFGDEGKGMATDFLASRYEKVLVVRHNGGAQSGHTVELPDKRFVFHELSSGSFRGADTFWAKTFYPDLYKLREEIDEFRDLVLVEKDSVSIPMIYADVDAQITIIDDVLINMAAETFRGNERHGSCGMGIYEAVCRGEAGYGITIGELMELDFSTLVDRLERIRREYVWRRLKELEVVTDTKSLEPREAVKVKQDNGIFGNVENDELFQYLDLIMDKTVIENFAKEVLKNRSLIIPVTNVKKLFEDYESVVFENGQGLLLDTDNEKYTPHVSASKTGLYNPCRILSETGMYPDEVVYVTRSYVTKHGAGYLPYECNKEELGIKDTDKTNVHNPWQGTLRYARHESMDYFAEDIRVDMKNIEKTLGKNCNVKCMLMVTHLNETGDNIKCMDGDVKIGDFCKKMKGVFDGYYLSRSRYGEVQEFCCKH